MGKLYIVNLKIWCILVLKFMLVVGDTEDSKVYKLVYEEFDTAAYDVCVRLTNGTNQIGCQSSMNGNVGVIFYYQNASDINFFEDAKYGPYIVLIHASLLKTSLVNELQATKKVSGILALMDPNYKGPKTPLSPESKCPKLGYGLYNNEFGSEYSTCDSNQWNPDGDYLSDQDINIPIFILKNNTIINQLLKCFKDHNQKPYSYPFCNLEMMSWMYAAGSSKTCLERSTRVANLAQTIYCNELGGFNIYAGMNPTNESSPLEDDSVILATAAIDSRSFVVNYAAPGANTATGFITLLAAAEAIGSLTAEEKEKLTKNIIFLLLDGEAFDYTGSSRVTYDMKNGAFPTQLDKKHNPAQVNMSHVDYIFEFGQLGLTGSEVNVHYDPVTYDTLPTIQQSVSNTIDMLNSNAGILKYSKPSSGKGLPPSSLHSFLKQRNVTGLFLSDFDSTYNDKYYFGQFDSLYNLGITYDENTTEAEMKEKLKPLAQKLTDIATSTASTMYQLAGGVKKNVTANVNTTLDLLYCILHNDTCSYLQTFPLYSQIKKLNGPFQRYVGVYQSSLKPLTVYLQYMLTYFLGERVPMIKSGSCKSAEDDNIFRYFSLPTNDPTRNTTCARGPVYTMEGKSPYYKIKNYDYESGEYSVWTESRWGLTSIRLRMFLVNDKTGKTMTLVAGLLMLVTGLVVVFLMQHQRKILFSMTVEPL